MHSFSAADFNDIWIAFLKESQDPTKSQEVIKN